uniref:Sulfotransferase n=1 Tax=Pyramimonas obovata TaxID=1411642 RepID=A0A7S0RCS1_9CHLO|mmetsp:Transcript_30989/g.67699  ORF Transcript_30989/g.67699 Transcript_30989/m.67699 type:complete len:483 (+) Transcript_30989:127-1575(+)
MVLPGRSVYCTDLRLAMWSLVALWLLSNVYPNAVIIRWCIFAVFDIVLAGWIILVLLARHAIKHVFNRAQFDTLPMREQVAALARFLFLLNPLEVLWRFGTAPFRTLPDVYILGEVRCGTTSLAAHLLRLPGAQGPFCPWIHPLGDKESFYFVGHYWGFVDPYFYRMCFPLVTTKWFYKYVLRRPFFCFDGCAQYLNAPWVPNLIKQATPGASFIACVRDPVQQNISWWQYEVGALSWGDALGLGPVAREDASPSCPYPPKSFSSAINLSISTTVKTAYSRAESLMGPTIPGWAISWPLGQFAAMTSCGTFVVNLRRYHRFFDIRQFEVVELEELRDTPAAVLERIARLLPVSEEMVQQWVKDGSRSPVHLNRSAPLDESQAPSSNTVRQLANYYVPHNEALFQLLGRDLGWHIEKHYRIRTRKRVEFIRTGSFSGGLFGGSPPDSAGMLESGRSASVGGLATQRQRRMSRASPIQSLYGSL